ncbi:MAG: hypothetical protein ACLGGV_07475 [Bacteroidia bacterium]
MIKTLRIAQALISIAVVAISFFISYGFFLKHLSYVGDVYVISTGIIIALSVAKFVVKMQPMVFLKNQKIEYHEPINPKGKSRVFLYEWLSWMFKAALLGAILKFFGWAFHLTWAYLIMILLDVLFWVVFHKKFSAQWLNNTLIIFTSRTEIISFQNVKQIETRYGDFYIIYKNGKMKLLKTDLISEELKKKVSSIEIAFPSL